MEKFVDTEVGSYFASVVPDVANQYLENHNQYIQWLEPSSVALDDDNEDFIGSANLVSYVTKNEMYKLLLTVEHNLSIAKKVSPKIKIPVNYYLKRERWPDIAECVSIRLVKGNHVEDSVLDFAIVLGADSLAQDGHLFPVVKSPAPADFTLAKRVLVFGTPTKRVARAESKKRAGAASELVVNGFQLPSYITKVELPYFNIAYPTTMHFGDSNDPRESREGRAPGAHGLSGSVVWSYDGSAEPIPLGMVVKGDGQNLKCIAAYTAFEAFERLIVGP